MRGLAVILALLCIPALAVTLIWDANDPAEEVELYYVWQSTNIAGPWEVVASTAGTQAVVDAVPGIYFWFVTASNFWTNSEPSNVVGTPAVAKPTKGVKVIR